jgi:hypothetical protein
MNRQHLQDDLLEPFPTRRNRVGHLSNFANGSNTSFFNRSSCSNMTSTTSLVVSMEFVVDEDDHSDDSSARYCSEDEPSVSRSIDRIAVASIAGDKGEFRRFQKDLRDSHMITGFATQQIFKQYIESQGRDIAAKRKQYPELSKVKNFAPMAMEGKCSIVHKRDTSQQRQSIRRGLSDRISKSFNLKRSAPVKIVRP